MTFRWNKTPPARFRQPASTYRRFGGVLGYAEKFPDQVTEKEKIIDDMITPDMSLEEMYKIFNSQQWRDRWGKQ